MQYIDSFSHKLYQRDTNQKKFYMMAQYHMLNIRYLRTQINHNLNRYSRQKKKKITCMVSSQVASLL